MGARVLAFLKISGSSLFVFAIQFLLLDFLSEDYDASLPKTGVKNENRLSANHSVKFVWYGDDSNPIANNGHAMFSDPTHFANPSLRSDSIMHSPILLDHELVPERPKIPESNVIEYPLQPGVEFITKRNPESITLPKLNEISSSKLEIALRFDDIEKSNNVISLPFEVSGDLLNPDLVDYPDQLLTPPMADEAIAKISFNVTPEGFVGTASVIETTQANGFSEWLLKQVRRCRFKATNQKGSNRNAIFTYYWLPSKTTNETELLPKN